MDTTSDFGGHAYWIIWAVTKNSMVVPEGSLHVLAQVQHCVAASMDKLNFGENVLAGPHRVQAVEMERSFAAVKGFKDLDVAATKDFDEFSWHAGTSCHELSMH